MYYLDQMFVDVFSDWSDDVVNMLSHEDKATLLTVAAKFGNTVANQQSDFHEKTLRVILGARKRQRKEESCEPANGS